VGTNAGKHARHKQNRSRIDQARHRASDQSRRRKIVAGLGIFLGVAVVLSGIVAITGNPASDDDGTTTSTTTSTTTAPGESVTLPDPPDGITLSEPTPCPPAAGTQQRVVAFAGPPPSCLEPEATYRARFRTSEGEFVVTLDQETAPLAANNFVVLARYRYYDGVPFHRIIPGFVIQAGDGDGEPWGTNDLGYEFQDELPTEEEPYPDFALAMANSGPNTNGSQFFVVLPDGGARLGPLYTRFGQVVEGTDVVERIGMNGAEVTNGEPTKVVVIESVTIEQS
jgi:peptidyl-prolyl cis-trans isomerase B (cyclophilin B)